MNRRERCRDLKEEMRLIQQQSFDTAVALQQVQYGGYDGDVDSYVNQLDQLAVREEEIARAITRLEEGGEGQSPRPALPMGGAKQVVEAQAAGILVYTVDGLEDTLAPDKLAVLTPAVIAGLKPSAQGLDQPVREGDPIFKVVDNAGVQVAIVLPDEVAGAYTEGSSLALRLEAHGAGINRFRVERIVRESDGALLVLSPEAGLSDNLTGLRSAPVKLLVGRYEGWMAPVAAVDFSGAEPGVYVLAGARAKPTFHPVRVLGRSLTHVAFEGHFEPGTLILANAVP